jgi:hypothetical protein
MVDQEKVTLVLIEIWQVWYGNICGVVDVWMILHDFSQRYRQPRGTLRACRRGVF